MGCFCCFGFLWWGRLQDWSRQDDIAGKKDDKKEKKETLKGLLSWNACVERREERRTNIDGVEAMLCQSKGGGRSSRRIWLGKPHWGWKKGFLQQYLGKFAFCISFHSKVQRWDRFMNCLNRKLEEIEIIHLCHLITIPCFVWQTGPNNAIERTFVCTHQHGKHSWWPPFPPCLWNATLNTAYSQHCYLTWLYIQPTFYWAKTWVHHKSCRHDKVLLCSGKLSGETGSWDRRLLEVATGGVQKTF